MKAEFMPRIQMGSDGELLPFAVPRSDGSVISTYFYTYCGGAIEKKPSLLLLHGSGADSVFPRAENGYMSPLLFNALSEIRDEWNVFFIEKRGVCLGDNIGFDGFEKCRPEYLQWATYENRVADVCDVLNALSAWQAIDPSRLLLIGSSEGSGVAAGVAAASKHPTHVALLPLSGGHDLYGCLLSLRQELAQGKITGAEFHEQYDWLVGIFKAIHDAPDSIEKGLWGHSYRRWASYNTGAVLGDLLKVEIPIYLGIPSLDQAEAIDLVVVEFVRHGKKNLTYKNYLNYDHGFFAHADGRDESRHEQVLDDILKWVAKTST